MKTRLLILLFLCYSITALCQLNTKADNDLLLEYYQNQRFPDAADYLKQTYPEPVTDTKILASLAYTSQMAGRLPDAESYYQRIYNADSTNVAILFNLGSINIRRGNNAKALTYYKKILLKDSTNFNVYKQLAALSQNMGNLSAAVIYLQKANKIEPLEPDVASDLAVFYINLKVFKSADSVISRALVADTANLLLLHNKALVNYRLEKFPGTIAICLKLRQHGEEASDVINMLGTSYYMVKNYKDCIDAFELLEKSNTATETSFYYTAMSYKTLDQQEKAVEYFKKAIKAAVSPNVDSYYSEMGDSYDHLHQLKNSLNAYQRSLLYADKPVITYYVLATLYDSELKDKNNAIKYFKKYLKTKPPEKQRSYIDFAKSRLKELWH